MINPFITAVVLTKNEEENIVSCLETLSWCNEILVIDDNSTDRTVQLAKKAKATVLVHDSQHDFSKQRNFALSKVKSGWILFVDADERVDMKLQKEIQQALHNSTTKGFYLFRKDYMWGKWLSYGETARVKLLRLGQAQEGQWTGSVHEVWNMQGRRETLTHPLLHYPHKTAAVFLSEMNYYTTLRAQELFEQGIKSSFFALLLYPLAKFIKDYIFLKGFLDGTQGFLFALMMSFHSFLVRGKLWLLWDKTNR